MCDSFSTIFAIRSKLKRSFCISSTVLAVSKFNAFYALGLISELTITSWNFPLLGQILYLSSKYYNTCKILAGVFLSKYCISNQKPVPEQLMARK